MNARGIAASLAVLAVLTGVQTAQAAVFPVHFAAEPGEKETFFNEEKLKLKGVCTATGTVEVRPFTKRKKKRAAVFAATAESDLINLGDLPRYLGVDSFHKKTDGFQLLAANPGLASSDNAVGTVVVADRKRVMSIEWLAESGSSVPGDDCRFGGVATAASAKSDAAFVYRADAVSEPELITGSSGRVLAECGGTPDNGDLNLFFKTNVSVASLYVSSFSDVDSNGADEVGYMQSEAATNSVDQVDVSGVADDHASGTMLMPGSNERVSIAWIAVDDALGGDCLFAGVERSALAADPDRIAYASFGPGTETQALDTGGMVLSGSCDASDLSLNLRAPLSVNLAHWSVISDANLDSTDLDEYDEEDSLDGSPVEVLSAAGDENAIGRIVLAKPDESYVAANFAADEGGLAGGATCAVAGVATRAG